MNPLRKLNTFMKKYFPTIWFLFKISLVLAAVLMLLTILGTVILDVYGSWQLDTVRAEAAEMGVPLTVADFLSRRPPVLESQNAANDYEAAALALQASPGERTGDPVPLMNITLHVSYSRLNARERLLRDELERISTDLALPFPPHILDATRRYVDKRHGAIDLISKGASYSSARYHVDWDSPSRDLTQLSRLRFAGRLLCLAAWLDAEDGRAADAVAKVTAGLALASSFGDQPNSFAAVYARNAVASISLVALMRVIARLDLSDEDLALLQRDIESFAASISLRKAVEIFLVSDDFFAPLLDGRQDISSYLGGYSEQNPQTRGWFSMVAGRVLTWSLRGGIKACQAAWIKGHLVFIENSDDLSAAEWKAGDEIAAITGRPGRPFVKYFPSMLAHPLQSTQFVRARADAAAAAIAALRFRNATGDWPASLDALVPSYLASVPVEPFSPQPLTYTILKDGVMVYSIGPNGVDDAGQPVLIPPAPNDTNDYDDLGLRICK